MEQCLTVVGRAKSERKFVETVFDPLFEILKENEFDVESVESLGDLSEIDGMSRFIAFIMLDDGATKSMKIEQIFSSLMNLQLGVRLFENVEDAKSYASEHYAYNQAEDEEDEEDESFEREFPKFTAEEIEDFLMFESLFRTGKLTTVRGKIHDEPVAVMVQIVYGPDQVRVTPYAIMVTTEMLENLELPSINERD